MLRVAVGANHSGYLVRTFVLQLIEELGHETIDAGVTDGQPVDYPEIAEVVGNLVRDQTVDRGILIGGTGLGMCIAANKVIGVRAVPCQDTMTAEFSRLHANSNVLCLSAGLLGHHLIRHIISIWLRTDYEGGRHQSRLDKINRIERGEI